MRGNIRKWMVVGALASAALLFPGCQDTNRGGEQGGMQEQPGTGGAGDVGMEDQGVGGAGGTQKGGTRGTTGGGTMTQDAGTAPMDAGTGGAGFEEFESDTGESGDFQQ